MENKKLYSPYLPQRETRHYVSAEEGGAANGFGAAIGFVPRIRTVREAAAELKASDPNTKFSEFIIRKLANDVKIRSIKTGVKVLVDYDSLLAFISGQEYPLTVEQVEI